MHHVLPNFVSLRIRMRRNQLSDSERYRLLQALKLEMLGAIANGLVPLEPCTSLLVWQGLSEIQPTQDNFGRLD